jgi:hypothetical protein
MAKSRVRKRERFMTACGVKSRVVIGVYSLLPTIKAESGAKKIRKARLFTFCSQVVPQNRNVRLKFTCNSMHVNSIMRGKWNML